MLVLSILALVIASIWKESCAQSAVDTCCYNPSCAYPTIAAYSGSNGDYLDGVSGIDDATCCPSGGQSYYDYYGTSQAADLCRCGDFSAWIPQTCPYTASDAMACGTSGIVCPQGIDLFITSSLNSICGLDVDGDFTLERYIPQDCPCETCLTSFDLCVESSWICDGEVDCADGSDEVGCPTTPSPTTTCGTCVTALGSCIPSTWICDSYADCVDGSDEAACGFTTTPSPTTPSPTTPSPTTATTIQTADAALCAFILNGSSSADSSWIGDGECNSGNYYAYTLNGYGGSTTINDALCGYDGGDCCMASNSLLITDADCVDPEYATTSTTASDLLSSYTACIRKVVSDGECIHSGYYVIIDVVNNGKAITIDGDTCYLPADSECRALQVGDSIVMTAYFDDGSEICSSTESATALPVTSFTPLYFYCTDSSAIQHEMVLYVDIQATVQSNGSGTMQMRLFAFVWLFVYIFTIWSVIN